MEYVFVNFKLSDYSSYFRVFIFEHICLPGSHIQKQIKYLSSIVTDIKVTKREKWQGPTKAECATEWLIHAVPTIKGPKYNNSNNMDNIYHKQ